MTRLYAIRTGEYSDTCWGPIFSTPEKAQAWIAANPDADCPDVEVHILDDEADTGPVYPYWTVIFDREGNCVGHRQESAEPYEPALHKPKVSRVLQPCGWYFLTIDNRKRADICVDLQARDLAHAVKIAADARAKFLALPYLHG